MRLIVNEPFIRTQNKIAKISLGVGLAFFAVGIYFMFQMEQNSSWEPVVAAYIGVIIGFIVLNYSTVRWQLWSKRPTPLDTITQALRTAHKKSALFSYIPGLPAEHILVTPGGLFIILAKHVDGSVKVIGDNWKHTPNRRLASFINPFAVIRMGKPVAEAQMAEASLRQILVEVLGETEAENIPVESVVVFTNVMASVQVEEPVLPALTSDNLRGHISQRATGKIPAEQIEKIVNRLACGFEIKEGDKRRVLAKAARRR